MTKKQGRKPATCKRGRGERLEEGHTEDKGLDIDRKRGASISLRKAQNFI